MARSRNIKPGFFSNDALAECEPLARLLFAGLWTEADREGRLEDRPKKLKAAILPYDNCDADALLQQLADHGFILRYEAGARFIQILSFGKHQDPHYKEKASEIPAPPGHVDTGKTAGAPSEELRAKVIARDGACVHCKSTVDLTLDHKVPRSKGGSHSEDNLQTLCRRCNSAKNNREAKPIIGQSSANDQGGESPLIPDSLIPDPLKEKAPASPDREPEGFKTFFEAWPKTDRKGSRAKCLEVWRKRRLEGNATTILAHLAGMKASKAWSDPQYIPAPLVYLNKQAWDGAEVPEPDNLFAGAV